VREQEGREEEGTSKVGSHSKCPKSWKVPWLQNWSDWRGRKHRRLPWATNTIAPPLYKSMKYDVSFSQRNAKYDILGEVEIFHTYLKMSSCLKTCSAKILKLHKCTATCLWFTVYVQFIQFLSSSRTIKMLYFHNSFQYMQKSATYAAKSFQLLGGFAPRPPD